MNNIINYFIAFIGIFSIVKIILQCKMNFKTIFSIFVIGLFELYFIENILLHLYLRCDQAQKEMMDMLLKIVIQINSFSNVLDNIVELFAWFMVFFYGRKLFKQKLSQN